MWNRKACLEVFIVVFTKVRVSEDGRAGAGPEYIAVTMRGTQNTVSASGRTLSRVHTDGGVGLGQERVHFPGKTGWWHQSVYQRVGKSGCEQK